VFIKAENHQDVIDAVAPIPEPHRDGDVLVWGKDWVKQYHKSIGLKLRKPKIWHEIRFNTVEQIWTVHMHWQKAMNGIQSRWYPRTSPEACPGRLAMVDTGEVHESGGPVMKVLKDDSGKPEYQDPFPWFADASLKTLGDLATKCDAVKFLNQQHKSGSGGDIYERFHPMDLARRTLVDAMWNSVLDGVEAHILRQTPGPFEDGPVYYVRGIGGAPQIIRGHNLEHRDVKRRPKGFADGTDMRGFLSMDVIKSTEGFLCAVLQFELYKKHSDFSPTQKSATWAATAPTLEGLAAKIAWFNPHRFIVADIPNKVEIEPEQTMQEESFAGMQYSLTLAADKDDPASGYDPDKKVWNVWADSFYDAVDQVQHFHPEKTFESTVQIKIVPRRARQWNHEPGRYQYQVDELLEDSEKCKHFMLQKVMTPSDSWDLEELPVPSLE
jgi:hypothetical protein